MRRKASFSQRSKILYENKGEHIVKFKVMCMEPCAMILVYLFYFTPFSSSEIVSSLDQLLQHIHNNEAIDQSQLQEKISIETSAELAYLHDLGIIHCDIKPNNILFPTSITAP